MYERAQMTTSSINDLPDSDFAYIEPGGSKDSGGKTVPRSLRHFPVHDAAHVRNALARAPQSPFGEIAMPKIRAAAKKFGVEVADDSSSSSTRSVALPYTRSFALDDIGIKPGDGRTVDAYAAVFNTPRPVVDQDGEYEELIDPGAFTAALRAKTTLPVLFNHGLTLFGTPSERYSVPIGVVEDIRVDGNGLFTRARYHKTQPADEVLEAIREGSITAYSFRGDFTRSDPPNPPRGKYRRGGATGLRTVRRLESTLQECGPATFAVYPEAAVVGMRALMLAGLTPFDASRFGAVPPTETVEEPPDDVPPARHSTRSIKQELQARRAQFLIKHGKDRDA